MALRDPRSPDGVTRDPYGARLEQEYMESEKVMKMVSVKSRRKMMVRSSRLPVQRERERLEGVEAWWRLDTHRHRTWQVYWFGPQTRMVAGLSVWASKPKAHQVRRDGGDGEHVAPS